MGSEITQHIHSLNDKTVNFTTCIRLLNKEENGTNQPEIIEAWKLILRKFLNEIHSLLSALKEEIAWSMLDERKGDFLRIGSDVEPGLSYYKEFEDENTRKIMIEISLLFDEGKNGFRQSFINDDYYEKLFYKELDKYATENRNRLEVIYSQDSEDKALDYPDENQRKKYMVKMRREELFKTRFGIIHHEKTRKIKLTVFYIIEQKEQDYKYINEFLSKYLALQIAEEHCKIKNETVYKNHKFKENVDVDKVVKKLDEWIMNKTIDAQRHWFIVYKVLATKKWFKKDTQKSFIDFINSVFYQKLKCSKDDFKKIERYFKKTDYAEWSLEDPNAPQCCDKYKQIADALDSEFEESKYAKPNTRINTGKIEKFR
mgnify:FL=1